MAECDNKSKVEVTGNPNLEICRCQATGASSTYTTQFDVITSYVVYDETTGGTATASVSGGQITITATDDDYLNVVAWGH